MHAHNVELPTLTLYRSEPKWVLKRLMCILEKELRSSADREVERKTGVDIDGDGQIGRLDAEKLQGEREKR